MSSSVAIRILDIRVASLPHRIAYDVEWFARFRIEFDLERDPLTTKPETLRDFGDKASGYVDLLRRAHTVAGGTGCIVPEVLNEGGTIRFNITIDDEIVALKLPETFSMHFVPGDEVTAVIGPYSV